MSAFGKYGSHIGPEIYTANGTASAAIQAGKGTTLCEVSVERRAADAYWNRKPDPNSGNFNDGFSVAGEIIYRAV